LYSFRVFTDCRRATVLPISSSLSLIVMMYEY
jgi:hypothetical protein